MNVYLDSSALVKLVLSEPESEDVRELVQSARLRGTCRVAWPEVVSALRRAVLGGLLGEEDAAEARRSMEALLQGFVWVNVHENLARDAAAAAWRHGLRGFDAVHLASGLEWRAELPWEDESRFATFDTRLAEAARAEGLTVWPG